MPGGYRASGPPRSFEARVAGELTIKQEAFVHAYLETGNASEAAFRSGLTLAEKAPRAGCYVYLLLCPSRERVLYVGKGTGDRMHSHTRAARAGRMQHNVRKHEAIVGMLTSGSQPVPVVFAANLTGDAALRLERAVIAGIGLGKLLNAARGSSTPAEKVAAQARDMLRRLVPIDVWAARKRRSAEDSRFYRIFEAELQSIASGATAHV